MSMDFEPIRRMLEALAQSSADEKKQKEPAKEPVKHRLRKIIRPKKTQ